MHIPATMKALILKGDGYATTRTGAFVDTLEPFLDYGDMPVPKPGSGEVLVKMRMASVNPSDLFFIKGEYGQARVKGAAAGFEGVGDVVDGAGFYAKALHGRRVAFVGGVNGSGAWAQYVTVKAALCIPVKKAMRDQDAAGHVVNPITAWAMFEKVKDSGAKSFIVTAAFSQLGKLMMGLAKDEGIVGIGIIRKESQVAHLKALGARHVLVQSNPDFTQQLAALMKSDKPRFLIDSVANQLSADIFAMMPARARWIIYGKMDDAAPTLTEPGQFIFMDKKIEGYWLAQWFKSASLIDKLRTIRAVQDRFISGAWKTEVVATVKLKDAMADLPAALKLGDGKVMIAM